jgi:hypothetical protein
VWCSLPLKGGDVERRYLVHLAYLDDSGSDGPNPIAVFGGVVIEDTIFHELEMRLGLVVERLIPDVDNFEEFHATQLFGGFGVFQNVDENRRHAAILLLLDTLQSYKLPYIYSAVDKKALSNSIFRSASPIDVAFTMCALSIEDWVYERRPEEGKNPLCLLITDDTSDKALKEALKKSFRAMRKRLHQSDVEMKYNRLWCVHDDMFFGDSKDSVGIQIADVCNYFMMRKLRGEDDGIFFDMLKPHAVCAKPEPDYSQCKEWLRSHGGAV